MFLRGLLGAADLFPEQLAEDAAADAAAEAAGLYPSTATAAGVTCDNLRVRRYVAKYTIVSSPLACACFLLFISGYTSCSIPALPSYI